MPGAVVSVSCELTNLIPKAKSPLGGEVTPALGSRGVCSQPIRFFCSFQVIRCIWCNGYHSNWKRVVQRHLYFILVLLHRSLSTKLFISRSRCSASLGQQSPLCPSPPHPALAATIVPSVQKAFFQPQHSAVPGPQDWTILSVSSCSSFSIMPDTLYFFCLIYD